jgi:putative holliday junction resolvase
LLAAIVNDVFAHAQRCVVDAGQGFDIISFNFVELGDPFQDLVKLTRHLLLFLLRYFDAGEVGDFGDSCVVYGHLVPRLLVVSGREKARNASHQSLATSHISKLSSGMPVCNLSDLQGLLKPSQCLLGLDPGSVVIGVAICDPGLSVASPLSAITRSKFAADAEVLVKIIKERNVGGLIVGLPKNMDGSEGPSAQSARAFARNLVERGNLPDSNIPVVFWDERLSTAAVERSMIEHDVSRAKRDSKIDQAAAAYILQGALDGLRKR